MASAPDPKKDGSKEDISSTKQPLQPATVPLVQPEVTMAQPFKHQQPLPCIVTTSVDGGEETEKDTPVAGDTMGRNIVAPTAAGVGHPVSLEAATTAAAATAAATTTAAAAVAVVASTSTTTSVASSTPTIVRRNTERTTTSATMTATTSSTTTGPQQRPSRVDQVEAQRNSTSSDQTSPKRNSAHIMEFFEEQEKSFQEHFRTLPIPIKVKKHRSPSPSMMRQSVGLDHLDNLVRLMEQLTSLRDENNRLKKKCAYLESTKYLLQGKSDMSEDETPLGYMSLPSKSKQKQQKALTDSMEAVFPAAASDSPRHRLSSGDSYQHIEIIETASDQTPKRPKTAKLYKRSFSTGSLEIPSDIIEQDNSEEMMRVIVSDYNEKDSKSGSKSPGSKKKSCKFSKWARVKKILTGQKTTTDNSDMTRKPLKDLGKGSGQLPQQPETSTQELTVPIVGLTETRSMDSGVSSGVDGDGREGVRTSTSSGGPPSPSALTKDAPTDALDTGGEWWRWGEKSKHTGISKAADSQVQYLNVKVLVRRQSSPSLVAEGGEESDKTVDGDSSSPRLHRSASYKIPGKGEEPGCRERKMHKTAWGRVKGMIHTKKDSIKKKHKKSEKTIPPDEPSETDMETECFGSYSSPKLSDLSKRELKTGSGSKPSTPQLSPSLFHQQSSVKSSGSESSKSKHSSAKKKLPHSGKVDVEALVGGMTDDFTKKMKQWEELKCMQATGFSKGHVEFGGTTLQPILKDATKKTVEWEQTKGKGPGPIQKLKWESESLSDKVTDEAASSHSLSTSPSLIDATTTTTSTVTTTTMTTSTTSLVSSGGTATATATTPTSTTSLALTSASTSPAISPSPVNVDELQRNLTESFSRKIQEWESIKYRKEGSPLLSSRSRKEGKSKLKKSKSEKEKDKDKEKEKDKSFKSEKSKGKDGEKSKKGSVSTDKGRQRRSASKGEKEQASQLEFDPKLASTILAPLAEYKITDEFAHKLYEWEEMKGLSHELSAAVFQVCSSPLMMSTPTSQQQQQQPSSTSAAVPPLASITSTSTTATETTTTTTTTAAAAAAAAVVSATSAQRDDQPRGKQQKQKPSPLTLTSSWDSPDEASPVDRFFLYSSSETSYDESGTTEQSMTKSNIVSLENAHHRLLQHLEDKKQEYVQVQESVRKLHGKLEKFKDAHSKEIVRFRKEMLQSKRPTGKLREEESGALYNTLQKLEGKIQELENSGEKLQLSMESAAMCKLLSMEGEENISSRLVELMEQMKLMLAKASQEEEVSKKSSALSNFEKFYCHAMQLQIQMNNLRLSHLERNKEIMEMKRQLLLQEVNNLLLQADITRRESELYQFQEARRTSQLKRWNTYHGGTEQRPRVANRRECDASPPFHRFISMKERSKELYMDADMQSTRETSLPDTFEQGRLRHGHAGSLTEVRFYPRSPISHINGSSPKLQYRSSSTPFIDSLVPRMDQSPIRMAPEGETHRASFISTLSPSDAELISRIPDGASQEIQPITTPATISHGIQDSDQSRLQISFTISLPTMNVQIPQTVSTSPHETTSISSQCVLCKTASVQRHTSSSSGAAAVDTTVEPTTSGLGASTSEQISKFHQGETLADWLKREPKCPELLLPECSHDEVDMAVKQPIFSEEPTTSPPEGVETSKLKESSPYLKPTVKSKAAAPVCRDQSISQTYPCHPSEGQQSSPNVPLTALADKTDKKSPTQAEALPTSSEKQTHHEKQTEDKKKPKSGKSRKTEKQAHFPESPVLRLSRIASPTGQNMASPPQVGVVSPIRRLKPATELLEECQKYRLGHLAYHTRGYLRGVRIDDPSKKVAEEISAKRLEKEDMSEGYVEVIAKRLSGEGMPAQSLESSESTPQAGSVISLHSSDSPRSLTKFGYHILYNIPSDQAEFHPQRKLPSWVEPQKEPPGKEQSVEPAAKEQQVPADAAGVTYRRTVDGAQEEVTARRRSFEAPRSSDSQIELQTYSRSSVNLDGRSPIEGKPDSTISVSNSFSLPVLSSGEAQGNGAASRSATCSALSEILSEEPAKQPIQQPSSEEVNLPSEMDSSSIKQIGSSIFYISSLESSFPDVSESGLEKSSKKKSQGKSRTKVGRPTSPTASQPSSHRRTGKTKKGTIGELCMQSMTFDLGISSTTTSPRGSAGEKEGDEAEESSSHQQTEEGATACKGSPETEEVIVSEDEESLTSLQSDKRKPRTRFFDSNWFCKSKKLFKVSK